MKGKVTLDRYKVTRVAGYSGRMGQMRIAAIDIGSNSVILTVAERRDECEILVIAEEVVITRLGEGVGETETLGVSTIARTLDVVRELYGRAADLGATKVLAIGTAVLRSAANAGEFIRALPSGIEFRLLQEADEGRLGYLAVARDQEIGAPDCVVVDIGGGSVDVSRGTIESGIHSISLPIGALRLTKTHLTGDPPDAGQQLAAIEFCDETLKAIGSVHKGGYVVGIGGAFVSLLSIRFGLPRFDRTALHGASLVYEEVSRLVEFLCSMPETERRGVIGLESERARIAPAGAILVERIMHQLRVETVTVSTRGIGYGTLLEELGAFR